MTSIRYSLYTLLILTFSTVCAIGESTRSEWRNDPSVELISERALDRVRVAGSSARSASLSTFGGPDRKDRGWRIEVKDRARVDHQIQLAIPVSEAIEQDDAVLLSFEARLLSSEDETGEMRAALVVELNESPYTKVIRALPWAAGSEWETIYITQKSGVSLPEGKGVINFRLGGAVQTVEVRNLSLRSFGKDYDMSRLPKPVPVTYEGREENASWRKEAAERIEQHRKADLTIRVTNAKGEPLADVPVDIELQRHEFRFSSAVSSYAISGTGKGNEIYRKMIPQLFNQVTLESELKWPVWERDRRLALDALEWLKTQDLPVRGHVLLWPSWRFTPESLRAHENNPEQLRQAIETHILDILKATDEAITEWDVINEPQTHYDILEILGYDYMAEVFQLVRDFNPDKVLFLNEALNFSWGDKLDKFEEMALALKEAGAPVDGLGFQCHYGWGLTPPEEIITQLNRFAQHGFILQITEFDIDVTDEELKADYLRDFYTAVFSHPAVDTIQMWGFWERRHWRPRAALWTTDWEILPAGEVYKDLIFNQWHTHEKANTDSQGVVNVRGFKGTYQITVGESTIKEYHLSDDGGVTVVVE